MTRKEKIEQQALELIHSGKYPVASLNLFSCVDNLYISDPIKGKIEYTLELYKEYFDDLKTKLTKEQFEIFLRTLKRSDVVDNQSLEAEDPFAISMFSSLTHDDAIDVLINNDNQIFTRNQFIAIHDKLLEGTKSEKSLGLRDDYTKFVGKWDEYCNPIISYFPLPLEYIEEAIFQFLNVYNTNKYNDEYEAIIKPIVYHGLVASLQLFKDGNTRYARLLQHSALWKNLNSYIDPALSMPIVYATRQYFPYRDDYRTLITELVAKNDDKAWENWINFNLRRIQDCILNASNHIEKIKQRTRY